MKKIKKDTWLNRYEDGLLQQHIYSFYNTFHPRFQHNPKQPLSRHLFSCYIKHLFTILHNLQMFTTSTVAM
jgi:hypothetical protein